MNTRIYGANPKATRLLAGSGLAALAVTLASPAVAQDADAQDDEEVVILEEGQEVPEGTTILVTGSRIRRSEATSSSPLQIIDPDIARRTGATDVAEIVQNSPIASGSSQITSAISVNAVSNGGPGAETISLRGLGAERTLVLLNSRRAGPAGTRGGVASFDLNVLPSSIIQSVEILKDGASSIYGSDAVAGVVNLLTKRSTDGLELDGSVTLPFESGGEIYQVSAAWGKEFDRGHIMFAGEYYRQEELERQDRDYLGCDYDYLFRTEDGDERVDLIDPRTGSLACNGTTWGHVWAYYASNVPQTNSPATLMQFSYGNDNLGQYLDRPGPITGAFDVSSPEGWYPVAKYDPVSQALTNSYHPFEQKSSVIPETERYTAYVEGSFDITDTLRLYGEGLFNQRRTYVDSYSQFYNFGYTQQYDEGDPDDPFPGWNGNFQFLSPTGILDNYDNEITVDYYRAVLGLTGDFSDRIGFDIHGQYSRSDGDYALDQILQDVISQQTNRAFGAGCAGLVTPISGKQCLQVNWVDPRIMAGDFTAEEEAYFTETEVGNTLYEQVFVEASVSGQAFELPAGWLGFAAGAVYRRDDINDLPGHITYAPNPDFDPTLSPEDDGYERPFVDNGFANPFSSGNTFGYRETTEAFAEIEVPLMRDRPLVQDLVLSASARVTNVNSVRGSDGFSDSDNGNITYKLMGNWQVNDWLRFRATYGTSYRAPALFELFLADQVSGARQTVDPCVNWGQNLAEGAITQRIADNCASEGLADDRTGAGIQASVFTSGGVGVLESESSRAITASTILTPYIGSDSDLAITIDYFDIKVKDEIAQLTPTSILRSCYDSEDFPNSPFCDLFERGQDGDPTNIRNIFRKFINVDEQLNRGIDFTVRASHDFGDAGRIQLLAQATYQLEDTVARLGEFEDFNGEVGDPKFTADINLGYDYKGWNLLYGLDIIGASSSEEDYIEDFGTLCRSPETSPIAEFVYLGEYCVRPITDAVFYHNLSLTKEFADRFEITAGVSNIFDTRPPEVSGITTIGGATPLFASQYDWLGRRLFVRAGINF
ncbi:TonB-dependent receptor [Erythrobacter aquimaris]|uniref:TonB-dependent receptor n=1 Tax=Qipengyuania aquimaris TaxID=255984 RepID=A0A6I4TL89_9SPHN|nr:TonB-dependent receptor [Qipengyuania aquimaris]MXO96019.1 TonB-dependent receptor [Qipengyuania aquimaris]